MGNTIFQDIHNDIISAHNKMIEIKASEHPKVPIRVLGRIWNDLSKLQAKLELLVLLDSEEHIEQYDIED